jgi:hypothetical protein
MNSTPNIFVIGLSKVGKTPLADQLAASFGFTRVSASEWIRSTFVPKDPVNALAEITAASQERLQADPDVCVRFITEKYNVVELGGFVLEGLRNPRDFALLFRPERDFVLFVTHPNNTLAPTAFETAGVGVIRSTVDWMVQNRLLDSSRVVECVFAGIREEGSLSELYAYCSTPCVHFRVMFKSLDPVIRFAVDWLGHYIPKARKPNHDTTNQEEPGT